MSDRLSLTAEQQAAVDSNDRRILLLAPAGSGKTEVLARRMERLLTSSPGDAFRLLGVTYTVKAADELRSRVVSAVSNEAWRVDCNTLHAFALDLLRRYGAVVGIGPGVVVFSDDTDRVRVISDYLQTLGHAQTNASSERVRVMLSAIDEARTRRPRQQPPDSRYDDLNVSLGEVYDAYLAGLSQANGIDFPGMLSKLLEAVEADPWIVENFQKTYSHVFVDEAQDLTPAQSAVLSSLVGETVAIFAVADERQSINAYAGGAFANARSLVGGGATILHLPHNFRCSRAILDAAEKVATHLSTTQRAPDGEGAPLGHFAVAAEPTVADEAAAVWNWVNNLISNGLDVSTIAPGENPRVAPEEIAVIARTRWLLEAVIEEFRERGVTISMNLDASGFLATPEGRLFFEALSTIADPSDQPARRRFADELTVVARAEEAGTALEPFSAVAALESAHSDVTTAMASHLRHPVRVADDLDDFFASLGSQFQVAPWSADAASLQQLWESYRVSVNMPRRSLKGFMTFVAGLQVAKPSDPGVRILTIHRVKGLEFRAVAIVGAYDGALPDYRAKSSTALQEERRALYVAMTRAKRTLRVSWPRITEDRWGRVHTQQPSRFLTESGLLSK